MLGSDLLLRPKHPADDGCPGYQHHIFLSPDPWAKTGTHIFWLHHLDVNVSLCSSDSINNEHMEFPLWLSGLGTWPVSMRMQVRSLASLSGLRIQHCCKLRARSQMGLRLWIAVAMAQAGSCSSGSTPSSGTSEICCRCRCEKEKKKLAHNIQPDGQHLKNSN